MRVGNYECLFVAIPTGPRSGARPQPVVTRSTPHSGRCAGKARGGAALPLASALTVGRETTPGRIFALPPLRAGYAASLTAGEMREVNRDEGLLDEFSFGLQT
jgi:hypothetical protein